MVDISATANRIWGMITNPEATLAYNSQPVPPWHVVAKEHVLPIILVAAVINGLLLVFLRPVYEALAMEMPGIGALMLNGVVRVALRFADVAIWAALVSFFAGALGGRNDFNAGFLLVALALTPHMASAAFWLIPGIGPLLWLASFIYAIVILYKGAPSPVLVGLVMMLLINPVLLSILGMPS